MALKKNQLLATKSKSRKGGKRQGAGRKPGGTNAATRAKQQLQASIVAKAVETGRMPLEVMIETMRIYVEAANVLGDAIVVVNQRLMSRLDLLRTAADIARDAAPYCHAKLASVEQRTNTHSRW